MQFQIHRVRSPFGRRGRLLFSSFACLLLRHKHDLMPDSRNPHVRAPPSSILVSVEGKVDTLSLANWKEWKSQNAQDIFTELPEVNRVMFAGMILKLMTVR